MIDIRKKDFFWGYFSQLLNVGSGVLIVPMALYYLSSEEMGLWYIFLAIVGVAQIVETGFQPTVIRMTSYIFSGAKELKGEGIQINNGNSTVDYVTLSYFIKSSRRIYGYIALSSTFILVCLGSFYLNGIENFDKKAMCAWVVLSASSSINIYFTYLNGLFIGSGNQSELYKAISLSKILFLLISSVLLWFGLGLISLSIGMALSIFFYRLNVYKKFKKRFSTYVIDIVAPKVEYGIVILKASWKLTVTSFGGYLVRNFNLLICTAYFGLNVSASYGLSLQLISVITAVSSMYLNVQMPRISSLQYKKDKKKLRFHVVRTFLTCNSVFLIFVVSIFLIGYPLLGYFEFKTSLLDKPIFFALSTIYLLELNHSLSASYLTSKNEVPFMPAAIISGIGIVILSYVYINNFESSIFGLIMVQGIVQACYNNWYWPLQVIKDLRDKDEPL